MSLEPDMMHFQLSVFVLQGYRPMSAFGSPRLGIAIPVSSRELNIKLLSRVELVAARDLCFCSRQFCLPYRHFRQSRFAH